MKSTITKDERKTIARAYRTVQKRKEDLVISKTREWKLLYSPLTNGSQSRSGPGEKDLCTSCGNRENCTYPRPEGGVWHCKDYKQEVR